MEPGVQALTFDVFGTVVDWRGTIIREGSSYAAGRDLDWARLADTWRSLYSPTLQRVNRGELPWQPLDVLERSMLDQTLSTLGAGGLSEEEKRKLTDVWTRLDPWPDSVPGLTRLKTRFTLCTLSNGSVRQLAGMAKHGGLPWDVVFSSEMFRAFKPDPKVYLGAAEMLQLQPSQVMMVAAHPHDLRAASALGLRTAYVPRPLEWGVSTQVETAPAGEFDLVADDLTDLAGQLGL